MLNRMKKRNIDSLLTPHAYIVMQFPVLLRLRHARSILRGEGDKGPRIPIGILSSIDILLNGALTCNLYGVDCNVPNRFVHLLYIRVKRIRERRFRSVSKLYSCLTLYSLTDTH